MVCALGDEEFTDVRDDAREVITPAHRDVRGGAAGVERAFEAVEARPEEALGELNDLAVPLARTLEPLPGEIQRFTPACDALYVPDIDRSLDEEGAKRAFWRAFRVLGEWLSDFPPY